MESPSPSSQETTRVFAALSGLERETPEGSDQPCRRMAKRRCLQLNKESPTGFHGWDLIGVVSFLGVFWKFFFLTFHQTLWPASSEDKELWELGVLSVLWGTLIDFKDVENGSDLTDPILAAEWMKYTSSPQDNSRAALLHDHDTYCIPEEPAALKSLVKDLKDTVHHQAELLLRLREAAEATQMERQELQEKAGDRNWTLVSELGERISQLETENQNLSCKLDQQETTGQRLRKELDASGATVLSLSKQLRGLHKALAHHGAFSLETIKSSTKWLRFYTGFDGYPRLMNFLDFLLDGKGGDEGNPDNALQSALTPENQLFLVLVRLRLGLLLQDLAFRFHISESTASRYWLNWTEILERRLRQIPVTCSRRYVDVFKPQRRLRLHGVSLVALDCAELFFEAQRGARGKRDAQRGPRAHYSVHGWALAAPSGFLTFGAGTGDELPTLPPFLQDGPVDLTAQQEAARRRVLSLRSLADKAFSFRFLRVVHPQNMEAQVSKAWVISCYLACLLHEPMGLA